jgi:hypothetical protein
MAVTTLPNVAGMENHGTWEKTEKNTCIIKYVL